MISASNHAVARYLERVRPGLDWDEAKAELEILLMVATPQVYRPGWCGRGGEYARHWLVVEGRFACPVVGGVATTVLVRHRVGPEVHVVDRRVA